MQTVSGTVNTRMMKFMKIERTNMAVRILSRAWARRCSCQMCETRSLCSISWIRSSERLTKSSTRFCGVVRSTSCSRRVIEFSESHVHSVGIGKYTSSSVLSERTISIAPVFAAKNW